MYTLVSLLSAQFAANSSWDSYGVITYFKPERRALVMFLCNDNKVARMYVTNIPPESSSSVLVRCMFKILPSIRSGGG